MLELLQNMKKLLTYTFAGLLAFAGNSFAEQASPEKLKPAAEAKVDGKKPHPPIWEKLKKPLSLTDDQVAELKEAGAESKKAAQEIKNNKDLTKEEKQDQMKEVREDMRDEVQSILTPEQRQKFESMKKEREAKGWDKKKDAKDKKDAKPAKSEETAKE